MTAIVYGPTSGGWATLCTQLTLRIQDRDTLMHKGQNYQSAVMVNTQAAPGWSHGALVPQPAPPAAPIPSGIYGFTPLAPYAAVILLPNIPQGTDLTNQPPWYLGASYTGLGAMLPCMAGAWVFYVPSVPSSTSLYAYNPTGDNFHMYTL
jgi:hypothetical protein